MSLENNLSPQYVAAFALGLWGARQRGGLGLLAVAAGSLLLGFSLARSELAVYRLSDESDAPLDDELTGESSGLSTLTDALDEPNSTLGESGEPASTTASLHHTT
jgi:hypothetical protein